MNTGAGFVSSNEPHPKSAGFAVCSVFDGAGAAFGFSRNPQSSSTTGTALIGGATVTVGARAGLGVAAGTSKNPQSSTIGLLGWDGGIDAAKGVAGGVEFSKVPHSSSSIAFWTCCAAARGGSFLSNFSSLGASVVDKETGTGIADNIDLGSEILSFICSFASDTTAAAAFAFASAAFCAASGSNSATSHPKFAFDSSTTAFLSLLFFLDGITESKLAIFAIFSPPAPQPNISAPLLPSPIRVLDSVLPLRVSSDAHFETIVVASVLIFESIQETRT